MSSTKVIELFDNGDAKFFCPACRMKHSVNLREGRNQPVWGMSGTEEAPTLEGSVKVCYDHWSPPHVFGFPKPEKQELVKEVCHTQITDGQIHYYLDSTHALAGKTIQMVSIDS